MLCYSNGTDKNFGRGSAARYTSYASGQRDGQTNQQTNTHTYSLQYFAPLHGAKKTSETRRLTRRCFVKSEYFRPSIESVCEKTGKQIAGCVRMSRNHAFHGGPKYIILSLSGRGMSLV